MLYFPWPCYIFHIANGVHIMENIERAAPLIRPRRVLQNSLQLTALPGWNEPRDFTIILRDHGDMTRVINDETRRLSAVYR